MSEQKYSKTEYLNALLNMIQGTATRSEPSQPSDDDMILSAAITELVEGREELERLRSAPTGIDWKPFSRQIAKSLEERDYLICCNGVIVQATFDVKGGYFWRQISQEETRMFMTKLVTHYADFNLPE